MSGPRRDDGDEVRGTLMAAGRQALALARERPLVALGILAAFAWVLGRSGRGGDSHRHGIW